MKKAKPTNKRASIARVQSLKPKVEVRTPRYVKARQAYLAQLTKYRREKAEKFPQERREIEYIKGRYKKPSLTKEALQKLQQNTAVASASKRLSKFLFSQVVKRKIGKSMYWVVKDPKGKVLDKVKADKTLTRVMVMQRFNKKTKSFDPNITAKTEGKGWVFLTTKTYKPSYGNVHQCYLKGRLNMIDTKTGKFIPIGEVEGFSSNSARTPEEMKKQAFNMVFAQGLNVLRSKGYKMSSGRYLPEFLGVKERWIYRYLKKSRR